MKGESYEAFVEKFKPKRTTDDCYTPEPVYEAVAGWVRRRCDVGDAPFVRPFWPGGDYRAFSYPAGCVVVDNPPFSILAEILRYYLERGIPYFLFGPHLTALSSRTEGDTVIVCDSDITFENGAKVNCCFHSNLPRFRGIAAMTSTELSGILESLRPKTGLPANTFPEHVVNMSRLARISLQGVDVVIPSGESRRIWTIDALRQKKRGIFGGALLVSDRVAEALREAERRAEAVREAKRRANEALQLSEAELEMVRQLSQRPSGE